MLERTSSLSSVLIMGHLNIHLDVLDRADTVKFNSLMTTHGLHSTSSLQASVDMDIHG